MTAWLVIDFVIIFEIEISKLFFCDCSRNEFQLLSNFWRKILEGSNSLLERECTVRVGGTLEQTRTNEFILLVEHQFSKKNYNFGGLITECDGILSSTFLEKVSSGQFD